MNTTKLAQGWMFSNPFAPAPAPAPVAEDAAEGTYTYALVKSAPSVPAEEVEVSAAAVEIAITWGDSLLHVAHLTPPRSFYVGEEERKNVSCDFFLPAEKIGGATRAPVVVVSGGVVHAVVMAGAKGTVDLDGRKMTVAEALSSGYGAPCAELSGACQIALPQGSKAKIVLGDFSFEVSTGNAGRAVAGRVKVDRRSLPFTALSMAVHLGLLGTMAVLMPPMALADEGGMSDDQQHLMAQAIQASAEREMPRLKLESPASNELEKTPGGGGASAAGESGKMGRETSTRTNARAGIEGPKDNPDVRLSRAEMLRAAGEFGIIPMLSGDPNAPKAPWGDLDPLGRDPRSAQGNMWGATLDDAAGAGGLGLTGIGEGGGNRFHAIGVGTISTIDHGNGLGEGPGFGPGHGGSAFRTGTGHKVSSPIMRVSNPIVKGRIPPEVIQRVVRQSFGRFRACYESGLRSNPSLQGRVAVSFVIGRDGAVSGAQNGGSDLPDAGVVACVARAFYGLSFPAPDGGIVTVSYPIMFTPGS